LATPEELKETARTFFHEIWNSRNEAAIDRFIPENAGGNDPDFGMGRESFRNQWKNWMAAFPDLHFELIDLIAEGDKVLARWELTGTHSDAPFMGVEPTGTEIRVQGMSFDRIVNGQCVEGFDGWDGIGLRRQLGLYSGV
jgi:predicted ester cyclase